MSEERGVYRLSNQLQAEIMPQGGLYLSDVIETVDDGLEPAEMDLTQAEALALADLVVGHYLQGEWISAAVLRELVRGVRKYIISHELMMGECVAWDQLKRLVLMSEEL